tara:strand:- start:93277 stop:94962 length:1686 start_codon:yes stop_codon:yes gene_type:complete
MKYSIIIFLSALSLCSSQNFYPRDYFIYPIKDPIILSGTFAELRSNHFHAGIDIKTGGVEGLKVVSSADGYISRIKISERGYGKALYITHPNGFTSVYAHLQKFCPEIENYVKKKQYQNQKFEIQLFPSVNLLKFKKGEIIGYSGNTGGSSGPHLHFEIRDKNEKPINPMLFGIEAKDTSKPSIHGLFAYPIDNNSNINGYTNRVQIDIKKNTNGDYISKLINAKGKIGFGIISNDQLDGASNKNGLTSIVTTYEGIERLKINFNKFSFYESKHINRYIDYEYYRNNNNRIQKLYVEQNNPLSIFKFEKNKGVITIVENKVSLFEIKISDFAGNITNLKIPLKFAEFDVKNKNKNTNNLKKIYYDQDNHLKAESVDIFIKKNTLYEDLHLNFEFENDILNLHNIFVPLKKAINLSFNLDGYDQTKLDKLFIGKILNDGKVVYCQTSLKKNKLLASTRDFGKFKIVIDKEKPKIEMKNLNKVNGVIGGRYLKFKIFDNESGIKNYRGTINGKWILMEYDPKTNILTHDLNDGIVSKQENNLEVLVTDKVGNISKFETIFYIK